ncbi:MAG: DUF4124 domain-containing protein [Woeseiaceae bacterium]
MQLRIIIILLGVLASGSALAQAYTWTDADGVVHYSDRPQPGATEVDLGKYSAPQGNSLVRKPLPRRAGTADDDDSTFRYDSLAVASPAAEETLWNIEATLNVSLALSPALQSGHRVRVYFDGTPQEVSGMSFQLQGVYRGAHNLQAEVVDQAGNVLIRSQPSRFYVQQTSVL